MFDRKIYSKLCKYIMKGNFDKFKYYIKKKRLKLVDIIDENADTLLHISCLHGDDLITQYLLKKGLSLFDANLKNLTPLHFVLQFVKENRYQYNHKVKDMVNFIVPYLDKQDAIFHNQLTIYNQLKEIHNEFKAAEHLYSDSSSDSSSSDNDSQRCDVWNEKFFFELFNSGNNDEYFDSFTDAHQQNSWDHWATNIGQSYYMKHGNQGNSNHYEWYNQSGSKNTQDSSRKRKPFDREIPRISPSKIRKFNENQKSNFMENQRSALIRYEILCDQFFNKSAAPTDSEISYDDVPWPFKGESSPRDFLLGGLNSDSNEYKDILKRNRVRWHVDRFLHRVGHRLNASDRQKIIEKVTQVSQILNDLIGK